MTRETRQLGRATEAGEETWEEGQATASIRPPPPAIESGTIVDRYVVLERLGRGGTGTVYAAYDPELDLGIALKLLQPYRGTREHVSRGQRRMLSEAQALARLRHENVVAVHDVGELGGQVFLAMEFISGQTLWEWRRVAVRSWEVILEVFL